ncbi:MerR family transcriptional regulator [Rhizohabitans arisaemae]|uniref:MerR family transcriptional regulator n=1 Tax=Rhizohabitans arisaemae TaxID=2720610 RepID=UPI0024B2365E|nr:MerR family transcriptional regulator [Rhizohabitans arisaemae]
MSLYSPGETAEETGFSLDTLRYYEKIGLLPRVHRNASGQRRFSDSDLYWLALLRCLRVTGMPIAEMLTFAELTRDGGDDTFVERMALLKAHDRRIESQIAEMREKQRAIREKIAWYEDNIP